MDIQEIKRQKFILESNILKLMQDFTTKTSVRVSGISIINEVVNTLTSEDIEIYDVKVDITL